MQSRICFNTLHNMVSGRPCLNWKDSLKIFWYRFLRQGFQVAQASLQLSVCQGWPWISNPPASAFAITYWDWRHVPLPPPTGLEPRSSRMLGKHTTNWATSLPSRSWFFRTTVHLPAVPSNTLLFFYAKQKCIEWVPFPSLSYFLRRSQQNPFRNTR